MKITVYENENNQKRECNCLTAFHNYKTKKSYLIIDTGRQNDDKELIAHAFIFDPDIADQTLENVSDDTDKEIVNECFINDIQEKREMLKSAIPGIIVLNYCLLFDLQEGMTYTANIEKISEKVPEALQTLKNRDNGIDIDQIIKNIDHRIELLEREEQIELSKRIASGEKDLIPKKVEQLFNLQKLYAWVADEITTFKDYLEKNSSTKDEFEEEIFELNVLHNIARSLINNPNVISEEIRDTIFLLCERSENRTRLEQILKYLSNTSTLEYNNLIYEVIKNFKQHFEYDYIKKIANYYYNCDIYNKALVLFTIALEMIQENDKKAMAQLYNDIGCCYVELLDLNKAIEAFQKSVECDRHFAVAYNNWAYTLAVECDTMIKNREWEKKLNEALSQIRIALVSDDTDVAFYTNKVQIEYELGNYDQVLKDCTEGCNIAKTYSSCKTLIQMRILAKLEKYESNPKVYNISFDDIYDDMQAIYSNEKGQEKFFYRGMEVFKKLEASDLNAKKIAFLLSLLEFNIDKVKSELVVRDLNNEVAYYTNLYSLYYILNDEESETKYRIPLFDVNHMNDPNEGVTLQEYILSRTKQEDVKEMLNSNFSNGKKKKDRISFEKFTFLKSFSKVIDTLPMWVQYGDDGKGCCIKINPLFFTNLNYQSKSSEKFFEALPFKDDYRLYNVIYINGNSSITTEHPRVSSLLNRIAEILDNLAAIYCKCNESAKQYIEEAIAKSISSIKYLFKDSAYEHEEEVRIIINRNYSDLKKENCDIKTTTQLPIPKVYVHSAKPLQISEIILGPKILDVNDLIPYINMQLYKMSAAGQEVADVTKSVIDYR